MTVNFFFPPVTVMMNIFFFGGHGDGDGEIFSLAVTVTVTKNEDYTVTCHRHALQIFFKYRITAANVFPIFF